MKWIWKLIPHEHRSYWSRAAQQKLEAELQPRAFLLVKRYLVMHCARCGRVQ